MASLNAVIEGLEILAKYCEKGRDSHEISASHDVIYAGPACEGEGSIPEPDRKRLDELGWFYDKQTDCWARFV
jgi:hypothetical protein